VIYPRAGPGARIHAIRHDWLEHGLLWRLPDWRTLESTTPLPFVPASFCEWLQELATASEDLAAGCSPARLVDEGPLARLGEDVRRTLRAALEQHHRAHGSGLLDVSAIQRAIESLRQAGAECESAWAAGLEPRHAALGSLERAALELRAALAGVPAGILLP
jgi:hypothetical protein